jgi:hypothetical protein
MLPEQTEPVSDDNATQENDMSLSQADLEELAEKIIKLLRRELEIEGQRTGKYF